MPGHSTASSTTGKAQQAKPRKPYPEFPLFPHATRRWAKKIRGKFHYFGPWSDPQGALERYLDQKDDLHAGRKPRPHVADAVQVRDVLNRFLSSKQHLRETGEITQRTFSDYYATCSRIADAFGKTRPVEDLAADDFEVLRASIAKHWGPVALGNEIQRVRIVFKYAYDAGLIDKPVRFGPTFKRPSKKVLRKQRAANGPKMFEAVHLRTILRAAHGQLKAMILLGINCGFGNHDLGLLPIQALDLEAAWANYPRPKTGICRRCPLWMETIEAIRECLKTRPAPNDEDDASLIFVTKYGRRWAKEESRANPISAEFRKLLRDIDATVATDVQQNAKRTANIYRKGVGFYALRHTFETVAGETRDQVAVDRVMGHVCDDMASLYRERISDERLVAVTNYVREWLFGYAHVAGFTDAALELARSTAKDAGRDVGDDDAWRSRKNPLWDRLVEEEYLDKLSGRDALNLAAEGDEAAACWIRSKL